jgi:hypothetical protein
MKPVKYISPLLIGGLIISFCACKSKPASNIGLKPVLQRNITTTSIPRDVKALNFYFYNNVVEKIFPIFKKLD